MRFVTVENLILKCLTLLSLSIRKVKALFYTFAESGYSLFSLVTLYSLKQSKQLNALMATVNLLENNELVSFLSWLTFEICAISELVIA